MKMTIDEALETIKGRRWVACSKKVSRSHEFNRNYYG